MADSDKDGIVDRDDKCPYEPGVKEHNGCPAPRKYINVTENKIELLQKILFATNKADIKPASFDLLNEVVDVMKRREKMRVHIEGHTDIRGTLQWNMKLSQMRAESVKQYLIQKGVTADRLTSEGYGPTRPVPGCENVKTTVCFDKNRRTEFVIVQQ
ncbi:MAG: OmpA family protein [Elusimicrobia bacterium]|nr:MAG: OmpA family protein [Elusimicrobiota bacterium]